MAGGRGGAGGGHGDGVSDAAGGDRRRRASPLAGLRGRALPRVPLALLVVFLVWDFLLPTAGPLEPHLLLAVSLCWLGVHVLRMPQARWRNPGQEGLAT